MTNLKAVKCGWKWLQNLANDLIAAMNARTIIVSIGGGLDIQETPNGVLLTLSSQAITPPASSAAASGLTQLQIDTLAALVAPPSSPASGTFYPFTSGGVDQNEGWLGVSTVDPTTCVQKVISVWAANPAGVGGGGGL